ncbi:MFS transporter [Streptomyces spectabilis]|uniref:MFS transporter n=2 Tax=Streptomyces spectabilis TaxID=68270 RepID=UPI0033D20EAD
MIRRYRLSSYLAGAMAARTGDEMSGPALLLVGLAVTGSASAASALLAGITVSAAVGGPVIGAMLDRAARPGRLLAGALAAYAMTLLLILLGLGRIPLPVAIAVAVLGGLLGPALAGGWTAQLPRVAAPDGLPRATALDALTYNVAGLAGPVLAGLVALLAGAPAGVVVSLALIMLALPAAWALPARSSPEGGPAGASRGAPATSIADDLVSGFVAIASTRPLARATLTSVVSYVGLGMLVTCTPLLGDAAFGSPHSGTFLLTVLAAAALAANALLAKHPGLLRPDATVLASTLVLGAAFALAATASPVPLVAAMVVAGAAEGPQLTALFAVRHREAPERLRGQIFTTGASLKITGYAVGAGLGGPLATWSLPGALLAAAACELLAAAGYLACGAPSRRVGGRPPRSWTRAGSGT